MKKRILSLGMVLLLTFLLVSVGIVPSTAAVVEEASVLEVTASNKSVIPAVGDNLLASATLISGVVNKQSKPKENLQDGIIYGITTDSSGEESNVTAFDIEGVAYKADGTTPWNSGAGYANIGYDLGAAKTFRSFLLAGSPADARGTFDNRHVVYYEFYAANSASKLFHSDNMVFAYDNSTKLGDCQMVGFDEAMTARYVGFRVVGGKYGLARITEIGLYNKAVTGGERVDGGAELSKDNKVECTYALVDTASASEVINPAINALSESTVTFSDDTGKGSVYVNPNQWLGMYDGLARGVNSTDCSVVAFGGLKETTDGSDYTHLYVTFDMGATYTFESFFLAGQGDGVYGVQSLELFVGDEDPDAIRKNATKPKFAYSSPVTSGIKVSMGNGIQGRYLVLRLATRQNASYYQCWVSEVGATVAGGGAVLDPVSFNNETEMNELISGKVNLLKGEAIAGKKINYLNLKNTPDTLANEDWLFDGYVNWTTADEEKLVKYNNSHWDYGYYDLNAPVKLTGFLLANSAKDEASERVQSVDVYLADTMEGVYDPANKVATALMDTASAGSYVDLSGITKTGRFVGLKLVGRGQYHAVRMTELGLYGTYVDEAGTMTQNLLWGENASLLEHFQVDARGIDNKTALTGPGEASTVQGKGNTGAFTNKRLVWKYDDLANLTDGDWSTAGSQYLKIPEPAVYLTELCYNTPWIVFTYYLGGEADLDTLSLVSTAEYLYHASGVQFYASHQYADLFKNESLLYTSNGEQYTTGRVEDQDVFLADPATDLHDRQVMDYTLTPEQKQARYRYVAIVMTRPYGVHRRDDANRLVSGGSVARLVEIEVTGDLTTPEPKIENVFTADTSIGKVTMTVQPRDFDDRAFFLNIDHLEVLEEDLPAGYPRNIENNWLAVDSKVFHFRLIGKNGQVVTVNDANRELEITFPAVKSYSQGVGILRNGTIERLFNATTKPGGIVKAGALNYEVYDEDVINLREKAILTDLEPRLVLLRYNSQLEVDALNGTEHHLTIAEFGNGGVKGAEKESGLPVWPFAAIPAALLIGGGVWFVLRRRAKVTDQ